MIVEEGFGLLTGIVVLTGIAFAIVNGKQTVDIIDAAGKSFSSIIRSATGGAA